MKRRSLLLVLAAALLVALIWFLWPRHDEEPDPSVPAEAGARRPEISSQLSPTPPALPAPRSPLADALNAPASDIRADLSLVLEIIATFRSNFPRDGNPVGTNAEITAVLAGRNQLRLALLPPDHPAITPAGELGDRWGTPFFFHAESAIRMEIRSAGPDRKMWTDDDVVASP